MGDVHLHHMICLCILAQPKDFRSRHTETHLLVECDRPVVALPHGKPKALGRSATALCEYFVHQQSGEPLTFPRRIDVEALELSISAVCDQMRVAG